MNLIDLIAENTYSKFKKSINHRTNSEQLHKAIKEVHQKLKELDKVIDHTSNLKRELCEDDANIQYWQKTSKNIHSLKEMTQKIYNKITHLTK